MNCYKRRPNRPIKTNEIEFRPVDIWRRSNPLWPYPYCEWRSDGDDVRLIPMEDRLSRDSTSNACGVLLMHANKTSTRGTGILGRASSEIIAMEICMQQTFLRTVYQMFIPSKRNRNCFKFFRALGHLHNNELNGRRIPLTLLLNGFYNKQTHLRRWYLIGYLIGSWFQTQKARQKLGAEAVSEQQ